MATNRETFIRAIEDGDREELLRFMKLHHQKKEEFNVDEVLAVCDQKQTEELWASLHLMCTSALMAFSAETTDPESEDGKVLSQVMHSIVTIAILLVKRDVVPPMLCETAFLLNGMLLHFGEHAERLQRHISQLSELWWEKDLPNRDEMAPNLLTFLLQCALPSHGKPAMADIRRLWHLRECLHHIPDEDPTIPNLLLQSLKSSHFLSRDEGRKFLSELFLLRTDWVAEIHATIMEQLPLCSKEQVAWYGSVYFRAWRQSSDSFHESFEENVIQKMMHLAIHASRKGKHSPALILRQVLNSFHNQKTLDGIEEMLYRLYAPILWRSLTVPNADVRANATAILCEAFPLRNPAERSEARDECFQKQFDLLKVLLYDPCSEVRCTAIQGVCRICFVYWELLPTDIIRSLLSSLIDDLAWDVSSDEVRCTVIKSLTYLLDNHLSHPVLASLLPRLRNCFHDRSDKVRLAFVSLLDKVKAIKAIKYWHLVPMDHLLARLACENPSVGKKMASMLFTTFLPLERDPAEVLTRCLTLWRENPAAARAFYSHAYKFCPLKSTCKYMSNICNVLLIAVQKHREQRGNAEDSMADSQMVSSEEDAEKENTKAEEESDDVLSITDAGAMSGFLETLVILQQGISQELSKSENQEISKKLREKLAMVVCKCFPESQNERMTNALLALAGKVPAKMVPMVSSKAMSRLKKFTDAEAEGKEWPALLDNCLLWGKWDEILELITDWFPGPLQDQTDSPVQKRRVGFAEPETSHPLLAAKYLSRLLSMPNSRDILLKDTEKVKKCSKLLGMLSNVMRMVERKLTSDSDQEEDYSNDLLLTLFDLYLTLGLFLHNGEGTKFQDLMRNLIPWAERHLVTLLKPAQTGMKRKKTRKLLGAAETTLLGDPDLMDQTSMPSDEANNTTLSGTLLSTTLLSDTMVGGIHRSHDSDGNRSLAVSLLKCMMFASWNSFVVEATDLPLLSRLSHFVLEVVKVDNSMQLIGEALLVIKYALVPALMTFTHVTSDGLQESVHFVPRVLAKCVHLLAQLSHTKSSEQLLAILKNIKAEFYDALGEYYSLYEFYDNDVKLQPMRECITAVATEITDIIQKDSETEGCKTINDLPPLSSFLLGFVCKKNSTTHLFMEGLAGSFKAGDALEIESLIGIVHLLYFFSHHLSSSLHQKKKDGQTYSDCVCLATVLKEKLDALGSQNPDESLKCLLSNAQKLMEDIDKKLDISEGTEPLPVVPL